MTFVLGFSILAGTAALGDTYSLTWYTIDGGGQMFSAGGGFSLGGTIGQPDASSFSSPMSGGSFTLVGGFWPAAAVTAPACQPCDTNCDGTVNQFDVASFLQAILVHSGCSPCAGDTNDDGTANQFDVAGFLTCLRK